MLSRLGKEFMSGLTSCRFNSTLHMVKKPDAPLKNTQAIAKTRFLETREREEVLGSTRNKATDISLTDEQQARAFELTEGDRSYKKLSREEQELVDRYQEMYSRCVPVVFRNTKAHEDLLRAQEIKKNNKFS